jgi:TolB protein
MNWLLKTLFSVFISVALLVPSFPRSSIADNSMQIDIYGPGETKINSYLAPSRQLSGQPNEVQTPSRVKDLHRLIQENLAFLPFVHFVPEKDIIGGAHVQGLVQNELDFKRFQLSQVDLLCTVGWSAGSSNQEQVELRAFDVYTKRMLLGRGYVLGSARHVEQASQRFCADLMQALTGRSGFFVSELAFVHKTEADKDICVCTPQGRSLRTVVDLDGYCLSPAWSDDGQYLAMSFVGQSQHEFLLLSEKNSSVQRITLPGNTIISPTYWPGHGWVISADPRKNPDIFFLNDDLTLGQPLVEHWAIDISPHFDANGKHMVFVSSRFGNPHIFLRQMDNGEVERISFEGTYNTNPSISSDGRFVAYSRLIRDQGHRIIVYDREKKTERQVTFGPGNDEDPAWGPDSYFLAFSSDRSGTYQLYLTTRHADTAKRIPTGQGAATSPAWKPNIEGFTQ